jgi:RNA polymerase sigma-70 factor (ECF subfamily)
MTNEPDDETLVERALRNDPAAFNQLVSRHYGVVVTAAYSVLSNIDAAKDCAQEAFMEGAQNLDKLREKNKFAQWIYGISRNKAIQQLQRQRLHSEAIKVKIAESRRMRPANSPSDLAHNNEKLESIRRALSEVPETYREVLVLKYIDGRSQDDIARLLGISTAAVDKRLTRGKDMLRESMQRWKVDE